MDASDRRRRASEEAATWWVRLQTQELARGEREEFVDWLRESAVHVAEMLRVRRVHAALERFQEWAIIATDGSADDDDGENVVYLPPQHRLSTSLVTLPAPGGEEHSTGALRRRLWLGAIAAGLAAVAIAAILLSPMLRGQTTIQTKRAERREVALADGSVVEIDPQTRIRVAFEEHTRRIFLERGRALFRVAKNPARPFLVQADGTSVRAVGTAFGVDWQKQGVIVTVADGKVGVFASSASPPEEVTKTSTPTASAAPSTGTRQAPHRLEVLLAAGQQLRMLSSGTAEAVRNVNSDRELAWAKGRLVFDNETVRDAVEEFNRYNRVQLHVTDEALATRRVSGVFDSSDLESFIGFLQTVASIHVTRTESEIIMQ